MDLDGAGGTPLPPVTATPTARPATPTVAVGATTPAAATPTVAAATTPVATKPAVATSVPTPAASATSAPVATRPAGTPAPPAATPKAGRPALPAAGVISVVRWSVDSAYVYGALPTETSHVLPDVKLYEAAKVTVLDAQVGWNAFPNETDGNVWYKVSYKDAAGQDKTGWVHSSSVEFSP